MRKVPEKVAIFLCRLILASCIILVMWQSWESLAKYLAKPQSTEMSMERLHDQEVLPVLSLCPKLRHYLDRNESQLALKDCGITADEYRHKGIWSSGACPDPKWLREKLTIPLEDMVKAVTVYYKNESPRNLSFDEMKKRKYYFDEDYGQCYFLATLPPNGVRVKVEILREALLYMDTPGLFVEYSEPIILETGRNGHYTINLEVVHALDYLGKECYEQNQGNYDFCVMNEIDQHLLNKVGCTTPFGLDMNNICRNQTFGAKAYNIMDYFHDRNHEGIDCKHPCSYLQAKSTEPAIEELYEASNGKASFNLPMKVRVYRSHYSFTGLSFVAEVGGYVGLFLGANFLQFSDLLMLLVRRYY